MRIKLSLVFAVIMMLAFAGLVFGSVRSTTDLNSSTSSSAPDNHNNKHYRHRHRRRHRRQ